MLNILKNTINRVFASGVDSDASAFITATGLSGTTQKSAITTLVKDLKASGLWSKMKAVYPMVTDNYNLLSYTEDFSNAIWSKTNATITTNTITAPNGTLTADTETFTVNNGYITTLVSYNGNIQTYSCYVKKKTDSIGYIGIYDIVDKGFWFNFDTGLITQSTSGISNQAITSLDNGWFRVSFTFTNSNTNTYIALPTSRIASGSSTRGTDIYLWGAQLENGSTVSAYQPILTTPSAFMASQMKYNLKDARDLDAAFRLTWSGGWTYSATGATPNGTNAYADTKLVPSSVLSVNSTNISSYIRNTSQGILLGTDNAFRLWIAPNFNGTNKYAEINNGATTTPSSPVSSLIGLWSGSRTNSSNIKLYNNSTVNYSYNILSSGLDTSAIYISARNAGGASNYSSSQVAFSSIGDGLTDQDAFLLNQIVEKYQVALSRGVQAAQSFYYNSAYSNEANTYLYSTQITGTTQVSAINTLINGLKANNLWSKMKAVYPFVTDYRNLLSYTEDFTNAFWTKQSGNGGSAPIVTANYAIAPNGTMTADRVQLTRTSAANSYSQVINVMSLTNATNYVVSVYLKSLSGTPTITIFYDGASYKTVTLTTDWIRYIVPITTNGSYFEANLNIIQSVGATSTSADFLAWGFQVELGTTATTYQPVLAANSSSTFMSSQMKFNLVNPQDSDAAFRLAFSGGWTYSTNGVLPNGTNAYADTFLIPSANLTESSKHLSFYIRTDNTPINADPINIGSLSAAQRDLLAATRLFLSGQLSSIDVRNNSITNPLGYSLVTRTSTTNNIFKNSLKVGTLTGAGSSPTNKVFVGALNLNGGGYGYTNNQLSLASIGDGLSDAEALILYNLIQQYQTDLSRQV